MILNEYEPYCAQYRDMSGITHTYILNATGQDDMITYSKFTNGLFIGETVSITVLNYLMESDYEWVVINRNGIS